MHDLLASFRQILRGLRRAPGFTAVALLTLALGLGATTAVYSLVYGVSLKALPYPDADRVVALFETSAQVEGQNTRVSGPNFVDWRAQTRTMSSLSARRPASASVLGQGEPERVRGEAITWNHFDVLGLKPYRGRTFRSEEDVPGGPAVCLLSRAFWERRYGAQPDLVGQTILLDGVPTHVLGIMQDDLKREVSYWVPLRLKPQDQDRHFKQLEVLGRLAPGASVASAQAEFRTIAQNLATAYPELCAGWSARAMTLRESVAQRVRPTLRLLSWAVGFVLLLTCTNLANLQLARSVGRQHDHALRLALGGTRFQVARDLLMESALLAVGGGLLGLGLAWLGVKAFVALNPAGLPRATEIGLHGPVVVFALAASLGAGLLFGVLPAWQAGHQALAVSLREGGAGRATSLRGLRLRGILVVAQVALALVLMVGAGLLLRSLQRISLAEPGFRTERLMTFHLALPARQYKDTAARAAFQSALLERLKALPGVEAVTTSDLPPLAGPGARYTYHPQGQPLPRLNDVVLAHYRMVGPDYFRTMGIPVLQGRDVAYTDTEASEQVVFVNARMASRLWPGENPIGRKLCLGVPLDVPPGEAIPWWTVAGVVGEVRQTSLAEEPGLEFYHPYAQDEGLARSMGVLVRTQGRPEALMGAVRSVVKDLDGNLPIQKLRTMDDCVAEGLLERRTNLVLVGLFALLALALTGVGVFGVMNHSVAQRSRELGVRVALGASRADLMRLVLRQALLLTGVGLVIGLGASLAGGSLLAGLLVGVAPGDPLTLVVVTVLVLVLSFLAALLPALRASRVQPVEALRAE